LRKRNNFLTIWPDFIRLPRKLYNENHICVLKGQERFKLASSIYRKNIYVNVLESVKPEESPLNFFDIDIQKYPYA
jgi:hypothetical protein